MKIFLFIACLFFSFEAFAQAVRPYRPGQGGIGGKAYAVPQQPARAALPQKAGYRQPQVRYKQTAEEKKPEPDPNRLYITEDTVFFKKYIAEHPEVLPDIKLKGEVEW